MSVVSSGITSVGPYLHSSVKTPGKSMEEQGDESEIDDGSQEDKPETD